MSFLKNIVKRFFSNEIKSEANSLFHKMKRDEEKKKKEFELSAFETNFPIGGIFITICNEWSEMRLVEILGYESFGKDPIEAIGNPIPLIRDIITGEEFISFSILLEYNENLIHTLSKLNPYERYALVAQKSYFIDREDKLKKGYDTELSAEELIEGYYRYLEKKQES